MLINISSTEEILIFCLLNFDILLCFYTELFLKKEIDTVLKWPRPLKLNPPNATFLCTPYWNIREENGTANVKVVNEINMAVRVWRLRDLNVIILFITLLLFLSSCKYEQSYYNLWVWFDKLSTIDNTTEILTNLSPVMLYFCKQRPIHIFFNN